MAPNHGGDTIESILGPVGPHWVQKCVKTVKNYHAPKFEFSITRRSSIFCKIATPRMQIPKMQPPEGIRVGIFTNRNPQNANTQNATPRRHTCRDFHESQPPECKYPKCNPQKAYVSVFSRIANPRMQIPKMHPPEGIRVGIFTNCNPQNANTQNATPSRHTCRDFHESQPPECKYPKCNPQKVYVSGFSRIATPRMHIPKM